MRVSGPLVENVFATLSGTADKKKVHWIVGRRGEQRADDLEKEYQAASKLRRLLIRNAYTVEGLTGSDLREARRLIDELPERKNVECSLCKKPSVADTGFCRGHNFYMLRLEA